MDLNGYRADVKSRAAVERKFEVVGEACVRLREKAPELYAKIPDAGMVVGCRNRLIHGYDDIDEGIVWEIVHHKIPQFAAEIDRLFAQFKKNNSVEVWGVKNGRGGARPYRGLNFRGLSKRASIIGVKG